MPSTKVESEAETLQTGAPTMAPRATELPFPTLPMISKPAISVPDLVVASRQGSVAPADRDPAGGLADKDDPVVAAAADPAAAYAGVLAMMRPPSSPTLSVQVGPAALPSSTPEIGVANAPRQMRVVTTGTSAANAEAGRVDAPATPTAPPTIAQAATTGIGPTTGFDVVGEAADSKKNDDWAPETAGPVSSIFAARDAMAAPPTGRTVGTTGALPLSSAPAVSMVDPAAPVFLAGTRQAKPAAGETVDPRDDGSQGRVPFGLMTDATAAVPPFKAEAAIPPVGAPAAASTPTPSAAYPLDMHVGRIVKQAEDRISIVLDPPELGAMHVTLHGRKGKNLAASIVVDRPETLDLLRHESGTMERMLSEAGVQLDPSGLQMSLRQDNPDRQEAGSQIFEKLATQAGIDTHDESAVEPRQGRLPSTRLLDLLA
ncbi:flagellar hook-length control protein FliK [Arboricoccus pini]|nr:flagellar hook-length control protein FliK [Arboricoccus pini]